MIRKLFAGASVVAIAAIAVMLIGAGSGQPKAEASSITHPVATHAQAPGLLSSYTYMALLFGAPRPDYICHYESDPGQTPAFHYETVWYPSPSEIKEHAGLGHSKDIIPPIWPGYLGQNWTTAGQAIYFSGCGNNAA